MFRGGGGLIRRVRLVAAVIAVIAAAGALAASANATQITWSCGLIQPGNSCAASSVHNYVGVGCQYAGNEAEPCSATIYTSSNTWNAYGVAYLSVIQYPLAIVPTVNSSHVEVTNNSCCAHTITGVAYY